MAPLSRPSDTRTTSPRTGSTPEQNEALRPASNSRFSKLVVGTILAAIGVYLVSFPAIGLAIGALIIALTLFSVGPLIVLWVGRGIRSSRPMQTLIRVIDLQPIRSLRESDR
jgi:predicted lipid-binding transport protein (Tim44 family)